MNIAVGVDLTASLEDGGARLLAARATAALEAAPVAGMLAGEGGESHGPITVALVR